MRRTIRLTERDLSRLVRRVIREDEENNSSTTSAMNAVSEFLETNGGGLGSRNNDDIEKDLQALEYAIRIERNGLKDSNQTSGYKYKSYGKPRTQFTVSREYDPQHSQDPFERYNHGGSQPGH